MHEIFALPVSIILIFCGISLIRGLAANISDMFGIAKRWNISKRNAEPDTPIDAAVRETLNNMIADPSKWGTTVTKETGYYDSSPNSREEIVRMDGNVSIKFFHGNAPQIHLKSIGQIDADDLKPELVDYLKTTCLGFKHLVSAHSLLQSERFQRVDKLN